jgi:hypothetical protein
METGEEVRMLWEQLEAEEKEAKNHDLMEVILI